MRWAIFLIGGVALFRCLRPWVGGPENFAPLAALALCGSAYLPRPWNWRGPLLALLLSDAILNLSYGQWPFTLNTIAAAAAYLLIVELGRWVAARPSYGAWAGGALGSSLIFYAVTNTVSWWTNLGYDKSLAGWWQALTTGMPGYPPTWAFLRSSVISDLIFTAIFVAGIEWSARRNPGKVRSVLSAAPVR